MPDSILSCADLVRAQYGVDTDVRESPAGLVVGVTDQVLLRNSPNRIALTVVNFSANQLIIRPLLPATLTAGIKIPAGGGVFTIDWRDDAILPAFEWHAISDIAGSAVYWIETFLVGKSPTG